MRIIQWNSAKFLGGAELRVLELSQCLQAKGHDVYLVCRKGSLLENKVKKLKLLHISYRYDLIGFFKLLYFISKWKPSIIHVHTGKDYSPSLLISLLTGIPVVCHRRLMAKISPVTKLLLDLTKAKMIAISQVVKDVLVKENKIKEDKIKVVYNAIPDTRLAINTQRVQELNNMFRKRNIKIIISVGNLYPTKGFDELIYVSNLLKGKIEYLVLIVGEGKEKNKLQSMIKQYGLDQNVKLLGRREDVIELLTISDCFVLLSYEEPFGVAFIEALACGKPVIGYNIGGVTEIIKNNEVGFLVKPHDVETVAEKLYHLLTDDQLYNKMSVAAKEYFKNKFSFTKMIDEIENVYYELTQRRRVVYGN